MPLCYNPRVDMRPDSILGSYRVVRLLGRGGMGAVYEAEHVQLRVRRALKVLVRSGGADLRDRFLAEGRLLARLEHPRRTSRRGGSGTPR